MAYIGHLCACGDMDVNHAPADPTHPKKPRSCQIRPGGTMRSISRRLRSKVGRRVDSFGIAHLRPHEPPALETYGSPAGGVRTCDCPACQELYAELTAQAA